MRAVSDIAKCCKRIQVLLRHRKIETVNETVRIAYLRVLSETKQAQNMTEFMMLLIVGSPKLIRRYDEN
jgi:hypothetical protein